MSVVYVLDDRVGSWCSLHSLRLRGDWRGLERDQISLRRGEDGKRLGAGFRTILQRHVPYIP